MQLEFQTEPGIWEKSYSHINSDTTLADYVEFGKILDLGLPSKEPGLPLPQEQL